MRFNSSPVLHGRGREPPLRREGEGPCPSARPMNLLMLGSGIVAFIAGVALLLRRSGSEQAVVARRIAGTMALALGLALIIFAIGLAGVGSNGDA